MLKFNSPFNLLYNYEERRKGLQDFAAAFWVQPIVDPSIQHSRAARPTHIQIFHLAISSFEALSKYVAIHNIRHNNKQQQQHI